MNRFPRLLATAFLAFLPLFLQAQAPDPAAEALERLSRTITLADIPEVAECRGVGLPQEAIDRVNAADEDPHETFERWRMEHRSMVEESPAIECQSKLWKEIRRRRGLASTATVPAGTEGFGLRSGDETAEAFLRTLGLRADSASVGANVLPAGGVENYQGEMQIAVNPNNPLQLVAGANHFYADPNCTRPGGGSTNGTQAFYGSTDGGATWTYRCAPWPSDITGSVAGAVFFFGSDPALAWDSQNRAYAAYMLLNCNSAQTSCGYSIVVARSTDVGQTWTPWGTVVNHSGDNTHGDDKEMIAVDNSPGPASTKSHPGRVYVIWDDLNVERVAYSDNGTSWTTVILPNPNNAIGGNVVVGRDGTVYVIWNRLTDPEAIIFSKSVDGGNTWSTPITIATSALLSFGTNNKPPAQESRSINAFGSIGIDNNPASPYFGYLYVVYNDFPTGTSTGTNVNVYVVTSSNGGTSWSPRVLVNDDAATGTQFFPWLSVDQSDGTVNVSWYDTRLDATNHRKTQVFYSRSSNGGVSFEPNILVTDNGGVVWRNGVNYSDENTTDNASRNGNQYGDYAGIVAMNRKVVPFWMDSRNFYPSADTVSPTRREDAAAATIVNCSAPTGVSAPSVTAACSAPRVQLSWSAPSWGTNATSGTYSVYRSTTTSFANAILLASNLNTTSYDDSTGLPTVTYYYFIVAKNNCPGTTLTPMSTTSAASTAIVFPACGAQVGNLQGTVTVGGSPISGATVTASPYSTTTDGSGNYFLGPIPTGTYTVTAAATGYNTGNANGVVIANGQTTTQNFTLTAATANACFTDTTQVQFEAGTLTTLDSTTSPGNLLLPLTFPEGVDQHADDNGFGSGYGFNSTSFIGQTFTPSVTAQLTKVDTLLFCASCSGANPNITLELRTTSAGLPVMTGGALASSTISGFASGSSTLKTFVFASPVTLTAGTQYGIVIKLASTRTGTQAWLSSSGDVMAGGRRVNCTSTSCSNPTGSNNNSDLIFAAYMKSTTYQTAGNLVSTVKDSAPVFGASTSWTTLSWTATTPASTTVRFQAAGSNNVAGPFNFVGPDGTAATFFTVSGASLSQFNGNRYLKYKAYLSTTLNTSTPTLSDVTVCDSVSDCSAASAPVITPTPATACANSTGNTASSSAASSYSWSITNGTITGGATSQTVTYTAGASGSVGLTLNIVTAASCPGTSSINVPIAPAPATPTASNGGPYCAGATVSLSTPTVSGATYSWTGPNGFASSLQNPTRSNATTADGGTYSVTVTVSGCTSAAGTTNVVVNATPATPTASNGGPYCEGATISLSTPTVSGATYSWTGPNGFTSSLQNPTRSSATTADAGTYSVTVTVNGCTSAAGTTNVVVNTIPATPTASNGGPYCEGGTIALSTPTVSGATYSWTGPNGFTSSLQNPTRSNATLAHAGTYSVTVTVNGCTSAAGTTNVVVNATPATPTASNGGPYCEGATISLSTPTVSGATYSWTGPNGFTSSDQNPTRSSATTADAGTYSVTVTVNGCTSAAGTTNVVVNAIPATPTASNGGPYCEGGTISLSTPTVSGATYSWTGPNGFTSSAQNPTRSNATLADAGTYSVTVTVNGCTSAAGTTNVVVNATPATPTASNGGPYCEGATISLSTPTVSGATYSWTGPNGFTSSNQNPTRSNATTADAGTYSVTITVNGCTSAAGTTNVVVNATPATPTASNGGPYCEGATIQLSTPTVSGATYSWTGPNGFTSSAQNPTRSNATLADAGTYSVTITVNGCTSAAGTTNVVVNAIPATPTASNGGPYCEGATISLSTPTVSGATYSWTGPNGFTSSDQNPTRTNATTADAGTYSVTVTVNGCTSAAGTTNVVVNATPATPTASNGGPYCEGATIALSTPTVSGATYSWTGPNGFTSSDQNPTRSNATTADAGTYSVTVTVNGCTSAAGTTNVVVNAIPATPTASNGGPYCEGATISLSTPTVSGATYSWTGPNGFTSSAQNPTRSNATTADAGTYSVTITVNGCTSAAGTTNVVVNAAPATPTASNGGPYCEGATISLSTPTVSGATYSWTGPNGFTSSNQNPTRSNATTADAGTYSVTITVNGCTSAAGTTNVVVNATPATPTASNGGPYCEGATISLSTPTVSGATYSWTGPNGFTSSDQNPTRTNATTSDAGTYSVTVTVNGCTSAAGTTNVVVNAIPATPTASNGGPYCEGATISLSTPTVSGATYSWTGPNGFTSSAQNPTRSSATLADAGTYSVTVTVNGCTSAAGTTNVVVNATPATPTASNGGPYCEGATIALSTPTVSGATYSWTGPNGFTSSAQNPTRSNATTADAGTYSVTITVNGCTSAAGTTNVVVNGTPATPTASNGGPYCEGATISLSTPTVSGATYSWTGPNGFTSSDQNPTRSNATLADAGTYSVTVTVNGCTSAAGTTNVVVNATPATPTASNGGPYCEGATISLSTPTVSGATYSWTGPNGFTSSNQNPTRTNATTADAGTYSVTVTVNGCTSAAGTTNVVVNATPATPTASNGGPYCEGATIALSTPTVSGATYSWTGPNGFTSSNQNPTRSNATTADAGTYSVTITVNGCTSAAGTTNVVVNATPATPTASNGGPYCEGVTISLSTPTVSGATYSWTGPNGFTSSDQNPTRTNATTADAGTYSVTITVNGCTSAAGTTNAVVNATPATPTASNGGPYCEGATIALSTPTVSGATYSWTGPNGFTSSNQNPTRTNATTADAGTYSVTITVNGCTSAAGTTNVVVSAAPATPTASNGGPYCEGATISLSTPTVSGATYSWTGPNSFASSDQNPTRTNATTADAGTYSVTVTVNGCTSAAGTTNVVVSAPPATPTASNGGPYCEGATIALSTPTVSGATYSWTGPNAFTSSNQNPTRTNATTADAGTYSVTITVNGCTSAAGTTNVVVNAAPATPTASNGGPYCEGATIALSTPTVSGATFSWTGPNGFTSSLQNPTRTNATTADAGTYSVTVTVNGCTSAAGTTNVIVNATPATPTASNGGPYCEGATISLSTPTVSGATYSWTGPGGFTSSLQNPTRSGATTAHAGTYSVTVTVNGCTSAAGTTNVVVSTAPATPTITPGGPTTFCAGGSVLLTSSSASGNQWYLNGNPINSATAQNYSATASGNYTVVVTSGCSSAPSAPTTVTVNPAPATPTITPGGPTTFCAGGSVLLTSSSSSGNQWYRNGSLLSGETGQTIVATVAGGYTVIATSNGCSSSPSATTTVTINPKPDFIITAASPMYAGASSVATVNLGCTGMTFSWSISGGTITSGNGTPKVTFTAGGAGTLTLTVMVTNSFGCSDTKSVNVTVQQAAFGAPPFLEATTGGSTTASLNWASVSLADHYEVYRSTDNVNWSLRGSPTGTMFSESGLAASTTYLYKVRAIKADTTASVYSTINAVTTIALTDDPLSVCGTIIKAVHITQLRTAINTARASVGLAAFTFTDPGLAAGNLIKAVHVTELRTALSGFLTAIGVTPSYTNPTITPGVTVVKAAHIQEIRDLVD